MSILPQKPPPGNRQLSVAGKPNGTAGKRNGLVQQMLDAGWLPDHPDNEALERQYLGAPIHDDMRRHLEREHFQVGDANDPWPAPLGADAYHGPAGEYVRLILSHTESSPAALLATFLLGFGSLVGRHAHMKAGSSHHYTNEFGILVGRTGGARKGTSRDDVMPFLETALPFDPHPWRERIVDGGLSSGEGLKWKVRDAITRREAVKEQGRTVRYEEVEADPGTPDKRLMVIESEFANVLRVMERQANTLSATLRQAWDGGRLSAITKNDPVTATGAHITILGHITPGELRRHLTATEQGNGFANRFLMLCVRRSKELPLGAGRKWPAVELEELRGRIAAAAEFARKTGQVVLAEEAKPIWAKEYSGLTREARTLADEMLSRAAPHALRLALIYAILDQSQEVQPAHLKAALAIVAYARRSVEYLFGTSTGDPVTDGIRAELRQHGASGMTRTELNNHFKGHVKADRIASALITLEQQGQAERKSEGTGGRPVERWYERSPN